VVEEFHYRPDELRQRAAFALSEILVVSDTGPLNNNGRTQADYYDNLLDNCFGNFHDILKQVTLTSAMGSTWTCWGTMWGTHRPASIRTKTMPVKSCSYFRSDSIGCGPMERSCSIPREILCRPTTKSVITGMARVFTGWTWGQSLSGGRLPTNFFVSSNYLDPMVLVPTHHELGSKILMDNVVLPAATVISQSDTSQDPNPNPITVQTTDPALGPGFLVSTPITSTYDLNGLKDLEAGINSLANHSSVGPYICRQLIQRLVTSNPSPAYVNRVVRAFNGEQNVDGVPSTRGDMKEVFGRFFSIARRATRRRPETRTALWARLSESSANRSSESRVRRGRSLRRQFRIAAIGS